MIQNFTKDSKRILSCIYKLFSELGVGSDVLALVGSWGDTLSDEEIAEFFEGTINNKKSLLATKKFAHVNLTKELSQ